MRPVKYLKRSDLIPKGYLTPLKIDNNLPERNKLPLFLVDQTPQVDKNKWVIDLSSRPLSDIEVSFPKKGLNLAVIPFNIPASEIVAKVESAMRALDSEQTYTVEKRTVNGILQQAKSPKTNITNNMQEALRNLK